MTAITGRYEMFDAVKIVKENELWANSVKTVLSQLQAKPEGPPEPREKIDEFERREKALKPNEKALYEDEAQLAIALQNNKNDPQISSKTAELKRRKAQLGKEKEDLDKLKDEIAELILKAGNIVFVPGPVNCIMFPPELQQIFEEMEGLCIVRYVFAYPRTEIDLNKAIEDAQAKKITDVLNGKFFYKPLDFTLPTISSPLDNVFHTLGSVRQGVFELELGSEKIQKLGIGPKPILELFELYVGKQFIPIFDPKLQIAREEPFLNTLTGNIKDVSLTVFTEFSKDGKITREEFKPKENELRGKTLDTVTTMYKEGEPKQNGLNPDDVLVKFKLNFTYEKK